MVLLFGRADAPAAQAQDGPGWPMPRWADAPVAQAPAGGHASAAGGAKKRKLVKIAAGLAKQIAAKMAQRGPEKAFKPFAGRGQALGDEEVGRARKAPESKKLPGVRKGRASKHAALGA